MRTTSAVLAMCILTSAVTVLGVVRPASAQGFSAKAEVVAIRNQAGNPAGDLVVAIPKNIDTAARTGQADFGIRVVLTYVSTTNTVEVFDTGRVSISADTVVVCPSPFDPGSLFCAQFDERTVAIQFGFNFGSLDLPGSNPSFAAIAELLLPGQ